TANCVDTFTAGVDPDYFGRPHIPMNLDIVLASHSWDQPGLDEIIVYDLGVTNIGADSVHDAYIGIFVDADVCYECSGTYGHGDDLAGSIPEHQIGYVIDNDGDHLYSPYTTPKILALKWLHSSFEISDTAFNWWISNSNTTLDFGPRLKGSPNDPFMDFGTGGKGTPEGDVNKYYLLSHVEWDYDQVQTASILPDDSIWMYPDQAHAQDFADGYDARFLMSMGPFELPPGATERVLFAAFTADSVHVDTTNAYNLPDDPDTYLANLNFDNLLANATMADSLGQLVRNTPYPVSGLRVSYKTISTVTVSWQRAPFLNLDGYKVYFSQIPPEMLPYPGVVAPWLRPEELVLEAELSTSQTEYTFENLDPSLFYFVNVASVAEGSVGDPGSPLFIRSGGPSNQSPTLPTEYLFLQETEPATIEWTAPQGVVVDHYLFYRGDSADIAIKYHPFYDEGEAADSIVPLDSFYIADEDKTYYYYALEPHTELEPSTTSYLDLGPVDDHVYFVNAVDEYGYETPFSNQTQLHFIEPRTRDILVMIGRPIPAMAVAPSALMEFYDSLLVGYDHDYYLVGDSIRSQYCPDGFPQCVDWHDFMRYSVVIVDGDFAHNILSPDYEDQMRGFTRYLLSGGTLAAFGSLSALNGFGSHSPPTVHKTYHWFISRFFGVDSVASMSWIYCGPETYCHQQTGFTWAESVNGSMPDMVYDPANDFFTPIAQMFWPCGQCAPDVASFRVNEDAEVTHVAHTLYPNTSIHEGDPIGLTVDNEGTKVWWFGFHLWYMEQPAARDLIEAIYPSPMGKVEIEPDTISATALHALEPDTVTIYFGDLNDGHTVGDIDQSSLAINGALVPSSVELLPTHPDFIGEAVALDLSAIDFLSGYEIAWGMTNRGYTLTGLFNDGDSLTAGGWFILAGHRAGDITLDGSVDISDLLYIIDFMFRAGPPPEFPPSADVDADCVVDISDLVYLVEYFFGGGTAPQRGCAID
ncbi:MAG: hypothetical protein OEV80_09780, partial [candidate division Zixibacteria bacterium]|nr:hypothetical protein [candidate division Zixibacteria bacterium]